MVCSVCVCITMTHVHLSLIQIVLEDVFPHKIMPEQIVPGKSMNCKKKTKVKLIFIKLRDVNKGLYDV